METRYPTGEHAARQRDNENKLGELLDVVRRDLSRPQLLAELVETIIARTNLSRDLRSAAIAEDLRERATDRRAMLQEITTELREDAEADAAVRGWCSVISTVIVAEAAWLEEYAFGLQPEAGHA